MRVCMESHVYCLTCTNIQYTSTFTILIFHTAAVEYIYLKESEECIHSVVCKDHMIIHFLWEEPQTHDKQRKTKRSNDNTHLYMYFDSKH